LFKIYLFVKYASENVIFPPLPHFPSCCFIGSQFWYV